MPERAPGARREDSEPGGLLWLLAHDGHDASAYRQPAHIAAPFLQRRAPMSIVTTIRGRPREIWRAFHQIPQFKESPHAFEGDLRDLRRLAWEGLYRKDERRDDAAGRP